LLSQNLSESSGDVFGQFLGQKKDSGGPKERLNLFSEKKEGGRKIGFFLCRVDIKRFI